MAMKHLYKLYPQHVLRGVLPKPIATPTELENLNRQEFIKCFNGGELYAIVDNKEIHITECNYEKAESLFTETEDDDSTVETETNVQHDEVNENAKQYETPDVQIVENNTTPEIIYQDQDSENANNNDDTIAASEADGESATLVENNDDLELHEANNAAPAGNDVDMTVTANENDTVNDDSENNTEEDKEKQDQPSGNNSQQPQHYNKNHNNHSNQSNYRNQKHGNNNKGKFVINK